MATGTEISSVFCAAALIRFRSRFSQYSRADELALFVSQYSVKLFRASSLVGDCSGFLPYVQWEADLLNVRSKGHTRGRDPQGRSYFSFASFNDPDGNGWLLQEITTRFPGRGLSSDVATLTELLQEAEKRHGAYEPAAPTYHWSGWYAEYIVARQRGRTPDEAAEDGAVRIERTGDRVRG